MAKDYTGSGKESTFGRNFMNYVASKLPYAGFDILDTTDNVNPKFKYFEGQGIRRAEVLAKHSISQANQFNNEGIGNISSDSAFGEMMYANVQKDKAARIRDYRVMAAFAEVADALDEICDEIINKDDNNNIVKLKIDTYFEEGASNEIIDYITTEYKKYIGYFELEEKGWSYFRDILVEGEVYFEQIMHAKYTDKGVLGIVRVPTELVDPVYSNIQNLLIKGFLYRKPILNNQTSGPKNDNFEYIPMDQNQVVYLHSGIWNESKNVRIPFIENARRAYRQLSLIEDSILIYRLVRAPERLIFNVDVGTMPPPKAEQYLRKLMQQYWSTKTFDSNQGDITNKFNPQSMLDAFWFAKRTGSEGTSVSQLAGGANLGELTDLMYFVKKLYKALKVPANRLEPESTLTDSSQMLREELKFAKFVIRLQQRFAAGIKLGFITHLKLIGAWEKYNLKDTYFALEFNPPSSFHELRESQRLGMKVENFNNLASNPLISNTFLQKKYLGWEDSDILANRQYKRVDAELEWEINNILAGGPNWKENLQNEMNPEGGEMGGGELGAAGGGGMGGGGGVPEFGGGPAAEGGAEPMGDEAGGAAVGSAAEPIPATPAPQT